MDRTAVFSFFSSARRRPFDGLFFRSVVRRYRRGVDPRLLARAAELLADCAGPDHGVATLTWTAADPGL